MLPRAAQDRKDDPDQHGDDADHHEQLDERERATAAAVGLHAVSSSGRERRVANVC
jgi:hypothetical protein